MLGKVYYQACSAALEGRCAGRETGAREMQARQMFKRGVPQVLRYK